MRRLTTPLAVIIVIVRLTARVSGGHNSNVVPERNTRGLEVSVFFTVSLITCRFMYARCDGRVQLASAVSPTRALRLELLSSNFSLNTALRHPWRHCSFAYTKQHGVPSSASVSEMNRRQLDPIAEPCAEVFTCDIRHFGGSVRLLPSVRSRVVVMSAQNFAVVMGTTLQMESAAVV